MSQPSLLDIAVSATKEASKVHLKYFNQDFSVQTKTETYNRVTQADIEAEAVIVKHIQKHFPDHNILAEEGDYPKTNSEYLWIVDPLDGTNNFTHGLPIFSVSIALAKNKELLLGVVYDVIRDELFIAEKGKGAALNGRPITVSQNHH